MNTALSGEFALLRALPCAVVVIDVCGRLLLNPAAEELLGLRSAEYGEIRRAARLLRFVGRDGERLRMHELPPVLALRRGVAVHDVRLGVQRRDGAVCWLRVHAAPVRDEDGRTVAAISSLVEIAQPEHGLPAAVAEACRYRELIERADDIVFTLDCAGRFVSINAAGLRATGRTLEDLLGREACTIVAPDDAASVRELVRRAIAGDQTAGCEVSVQTPAQRRLSLEIRAWAVRDHGAAIAIHGIARDVTERRFRESQLRHAALHDALTGLPNRTLLYDRLRHALAAAGRERESLALLFLDLDRFKAVNDAFGHLGGDQLLQQVAGRLLRSLRESDTVARLGGDEFAVLLPATDAAGAEVAATKIRDAFASPFVVDGRSVSIAASAGAALFPEHADSAEELLHRADLAMYLAKRIGCGLMLYEEAEPTAST